MKHTAKKLTPISFIHGILKQGAMENTGWSEAEEDTPQGGVICRMIG